MPAIKELPIKFKLHHIETIQYAVLNKPANRADLKYSADFKYTVLEDERLVTCYFKYILKALEKDLLLIEVAINFAIEPVSFKRLYTKEKNLVLPKQTAIHFALICVGTSRGILHEKTKDGDFNQFPIPTIDLTKRITDDISFR